MDVADHVRQQPDRLLGLEIRHGRRRLAAKAPDCIAQDLDNVVWVRAASAGDVALPLKRNVGVVILAVPLVTLYVIGKARCACAGADEDAIRVDSHLPQRLATQDVLDTLV